MTARKKFAVAALSTAILLPAAHRLLAADKSAPPASAQKAAAQESGEINTLSDKEKAEGWKLLFDGHDLSGWHNFGKTDIRPGWQVKDGVLVCADPHNAGDIVTNDKYDWFELQLDYNISKGGNSGIMFR